MKKNYEHYYTLSWATTGKDGRTRHYSRHLDNLDKAISTARKIAEKPETKLSKIRELESWDEGPVTHVSLIGFVQY